ncbi:MAG: AAA family ATPase [Fibrobacter sp.]|uniref:AAA family ATPase n=1 Tax=Fibrobacter sp. TaxID=35828 RepID=UPI001B0E0379|nr:AAA family ATPase [Fibrobacter sp.]MBO7060409.1 AAA family ATPase [Fibrobacter sp.]
MPTAPDVVSSIFRKYEKQELSPEFIRDESNNICDILEITRYGDPGRTARMFAEQGYVAKVNGTCKYDPDAIPLNKKYEFEKYEYVYGYQNFENSKKRMEKRKIDDLFNQLKRLVDENPENQDYLNNILNPIKQPEHHDAPPHTPSQIIYYGVPGCGKSHEIKKKLKNVPDYNKIRTVFHPEYSNADFVGQILPEVNIDTNGRSIVEYKFKPGPFTEIVRRAYLNPDESFYLVIEEINRGNAAAIFGEMFQLLDRLDADENADEVSSEHIYGKGWSSYGVDNQDVNAYIRNQVVISQEKPEHCSNVTGSAGDLNPRLYKSMDIESENVTVTWREKNENGFTPKSKHIHFTANTAIRLPPNLSIYATMNTSDQNVFTLDNAFQRRWEMKQVPNKLRNSLPENATEEQKKDLEAEIAQYDESIGETNVKWGVFRDEINKIIMRSAEDNGLSSMEDKRLGGWFIVPKKPDEKEDSKAVITKQAFAEKVLKYLWDDAFKFDRNSHFNFNKDEEPTLEKLIENFDTKEFEVFIDPKIRELQKKTPSGDSPQNAATKEQ